MLGKTALIHFFILKTLFSHAIKYYKTVAEEKIVCASSFSCSLFCVCTDISRYSFLSASLGSSCTGAKTQIVLQVLFVRSINKL